MRYSVIKLYIKRRSPYVRSCKSVCIMLLYYSVAKGLDTPLCAYLSFYAPPYSHWEAGEGEWQPTFHTPPCLNWCLTLPNITGIVVISLCSRPPVMRCKVQIGPCMVHGKRSRCSGAAPPTHCSMSHLCVPSSSLHPAYCARRSKLKHSQSSQRYPASWQEPGSSFLVSALLLR